MKTLIAVFFLVSVSCASLAQNNKLYPFKTDASFNQSLSKIIHECGLDSSFDAGEDGHLKISLAVIDLNQKVPVIAGVNMDSFIYPASVYKMYVAMEILKQVSEKKYSLFKNYVVHSPNDVDHSSEISWDPRPLLRDGDTVTIQYLLDLMITRSDNSAANCLIDVAGRKNINNTMHQYGWYGSEVTRKYLSRKLEDAGFDTVRSTVTNARHAAEFMYLIQTNRLVNPWVSKKLKIFLGQQLDTTKLSTGLPSNAMFYHKSGWWSYFTNDVGIVDDGNIKYIIALFTPLEEESARPRMKLLSQKVYLLMKERSKF
ncbi:MAG: serine hydrolase [Ginsengibacter sp.]